MQPYQQRLRRSLPWDDDRRSLIVASPLLHFPSKRHCGGSEQHPAWQTLAVSEAAVYMSSSVAAVRALWDRSGLLAGPVIGAQLSQFAEALVAAHAAGERSAAVPVGNWSDHGDDELRSTGRLSLQRARLIVARDHGFTTWSSIEGECDPLFEVAVDAVVLGRAKQLTDLLAEHPDLVARRSAYGHRATLLHYTAANGVEIRRQVVPANAVEIAAALLAAGADRSAKLHAYGGTFDVLEMLKTSAHPHTAGVAAEIEHVLATS
jgi:hypothetical protein